MYININEYVGANIMFTVIGKHNNQRTSLGT
jgi:hypothetical protein